MKPAQNRPDYGLDAPSIARAVVLFVVIGGLLAFFLSRSASAAAQVAASLLFPFVQTGLCALLLSLIYVKHEKFRHRDRMLNRLIWTGEERVLDIGTGRGLLLIGAAKRLTTGRSVGIDIWNQSDLSGNSPEAALNNAQKEGVRDKAAVLSADARHLPFGDNSFDYVLSNLCLHNLPTAEGRAAACREILRVLKPGGTALVSDFLHTGEYAGVFARCGFPATRSASFLLAPFLLTIVQVQK